MALSIVISRFITGLITRLWFYIVVLIIYCIKLITIPIFYPIYIILKAIIWQPALIPLIFPFLAKIKWVERAKIAFAKGGSEFQFDNQVSIGENTAVPQPAKFALSIKAVVLKADTAVF